MTDDEKRKKKRDYQRKYREENPEKCRASVRRWAAENPTKKRECARSWREKNPRKHRESERRSDVKRRYGLTLEEYDTIIARGCAICGRSEGSMHLDHCHATGLVRDCLCSECNHGIGLFKDDPALLAKAIAYLRAHL